MQTIGLIGYPLGHSISPAFQQAALDYCKVDAHYVLWETKPSRLKEKVDRIRREDILGANVTVPYKEEVAHYVDMLWGAAAAVQAVNVVVRKGSKLYGHNTDTAGFLRALTEDGGFDPKGKKTVVLGAGGAARAVVYTLISRGTASITVVNRTVERARFLFCSYANFMAPGQEVSVLSMDDELLASVLKDCDLLVNCTSIGMKGVTDEGRMPVQKRLIPKGALVYDLVYNPVETPLLREAKKAGARVLGGLPMLVYQGAAAFEIWTGKKAPIDIMFKAARKALKG